MRRALTLLAVVSMLLGVMAAPAAADEPIVFRDSVTFDDLDPCTGELQTITIDFLIEIHEHEDEFRVRVRRTGTTSAGYIMAHGKETYVETNGTAAGQFSDPWNNPATGDKFGVQGRFLEVDGEVLVDDFRFVCLSGPTILPG